MSDTRIGLKLNKEDAQAARKILKKHETTLSAWMRLQIRWLIELNKPKKQ
jgi:hypothetical protein